MTISYEDKPEGCKPDDDDITMVEADGGTVL